MKLQKTILIISIFFNLIFITFVIKKIYDIYFSNSLSHQIVLDDKDNIKYWLNRNQLFEVLPKDTNSIIFIGNSLTQNFELAELFNNTKLKNRGINGDLVEGVINRLGPIIESKPKKIFIEIGVNDLGIGIHRHRVIRNYKKLIDILLNNCKSTKIYINSLFPVEVGRKIHPTFCNESVKNDIIKINEDLYEYAKEKKITFIDTHKKFELNGQLNPKYSVDGIHLTGEGYLLWSDILRPYVNE
jgi:lysophospholipase L1-like esterase